MEQLGEMEQLILLIPKEVTYERYCLVIFCLSFSFVLVLPYFVLRSAGKTSTTFSTSEKQNPKQSSLIQAHFALASDNNISHALAYGSPKRTSAFSFLPRFDATQALSEYTHCQMESATC